MGWFRLKKTLVSQVWRHSVNPQEGENLLPKTHTLGRAPHTHVNEHKHGIQIPVLTQVPALTQASCTHTREFHYSGAEALAGDGRVGRLGFF